MVVVLALNHVSSWNGNKDTLFSVQFKAHKVMLDNLLWTNFLERDDNLSQSSQHCQMVGFEPVLYKYDWSGLVLRWR